MVQVSPFRALRPTSNLASQVASVPYDVVSTEEARLLAQNNSLSFLHVTKPEIDIDGDPYSEVVYQQGAKALVKLREDHVLQQDATDCYYIYQLVWRGRTQTGIALCASVEDYEQNLVRKHELTRPDKEDDRVRHMEVAGAQTGTVFLVHRDSADLQTIVETTTQTTPVVDFTAIDGVEHRVWIVSDNATIQVITTAFAAMPSIYIADGHHRSAAAARVAKSLGTTQSQKFLAVSFAASETQILPYNRAVRDLNGMTPKSLLVALEEHFRVSDGKISVLKKRQFNMHLAGKWYALELKEAPQIGSVVDNLDISLLQNLVLGPMLGIGDPRLDKRIEFIGGIRGDAALEKAAVGFSVCATSIDELLSVADAGLLMPPKSTWFEPKLRDGLLTHLL
jgi:uncharacterized protein (DUF1015 family)